MSPPPTSSLATLAPLPLQRQPLEILLPLPSSNPTHHAIELLQDLVLQILNSPSTRRNSEADESTPRGGAKGYNDQIFSVTFSPVLCPEPGTKNDLFVLSPHWWRTVSGEWEWRDGQRNPECARPQGQIQLQDMAKTVHTLALGVIHLQDDDVKVQCRKKIERILRAFFMTPETRMNPEVWSAQCTPSAHEPLRGNAQFVVAGTHVKPHANSSHLSDVSVCWCQGGHSLNLLDVLISFNLGSNSPGLKQIRYLILVDQALLLVQEQLDQEVVSGVKNWLDKQVEWMRTSPQGIEARQRTKPTWYHVIVASHLSGLRPAEAREYALDSLKAHIARNPTPFSVLEESMHHHNRRHRCLFTIEPLFLLASLALQLPAPSPSHAGENEQNEIEASEAGQPTAEDSQQIVSWLAECVAFVRGVVKGPIETPREDDQRFFAKIDWFERLLDSLRKDHTPKTVHTVKQAEGDDRGVGAGDGSEDGSTQGGSAKQEPDGCGWEDGWDQRMRMLWGFV
ncbi:hypothetical protein I316_01024 [Kwoniella heveanensis BCC8398]|uniref:Alginate lyase domain-containing protein n=1 Tax=Kwoniella heveanensis BCC8398 TaxID=1296120 RepID=A0A1B9H1H4_9TREE|nr:hypothetical protein I316_01024 [Kwoniella heveanensis BCC8398]